MIADRKKFYSGILLLSAFTIVLIIIFMPFFKGQNGLSYLDSLYNSISKGSAYFIPKLRQEAQEFAGRTISVTLTMADERRARETESLFIKSGAQVEASGATLWQLRDYPTLAFTTDGRQLWWDSR